MNTNIILVFIEFHPEDAGTFSGFLFLLNYIMSFINFNNLQACQSFQVFEYLAAFLGYIQFPRNLDAALKRIIELEPDVVKPFQFFGNAVKVGVAEFEQPLCP